MVSITLNLYGKYAYQLQRELGKNQGELTVPVNAKFVFDSVEGRSKVVVQLQTQKTKPGFGGE